MKLPISVYYKIVNGDLTAYEEYEIIVRYAVSLADNCKTGKDAADSILSAFGIELDIPA